MSLPARQVLPCHVLAAAGVLAPLVALMAPRGLAPLCILILLALLPLAWKEQPWRRVSHGPTWTLIALVGWSLLSLFWTLDPLQGLRTGVGAVAELAGGLFLIGLAAGLNDEDRKRIGRALAIGVSIALAMLVIEVATGHLFRYIMPVPPVREPDIPAAMLSRLSRGQTVVTMLALPAILMTWRDGKRLWAVTMGCAVLAVAAKGHPLSIKVAVPLVAMAFLALKFWPRPSSIAITVVLAAIMAGIPALALLPSPQETMDASESWLPRSAHHRLTIWNFGAIRTLEKPILGWGIDASRSIPDGDDEIKINVRSPRYGNYILSEAKMPLHPHNVAVQVWLELGGIGAALTVLALAMIMRAIARIPDRDNRGIAAAVLTLVVIVDLVSYGMWQSWWLCAVCLAAALTVIARQDGTRRTVPATAPPRSAADLTPSG